MLAYRASAEEQDYSPDSSRGTSSPVQSIGRKLGLAGMLGGVVLERVRVLPGDLSWVGITLEELLDGAANFEVAFPEFSVEVTAEVHQVTDEELVRLQLWFGISVAGIQT